jgi:hypothetical protein
MEGAGIRVIISRPPNSGERTLPVSETTAAQPD